MELMIGRTVAYAVAMIASLDVFAATVGENLVRADFAGDGVGGILDWSVCRSLGGVRTTRLKEKGPDGKPVLRRNLYSVPYRGGRKFDEKYTTPSRSIRSRI